MKVSSRSVAALILSAIPAASAIQRKLVGPYGDGETDCPDVSPTAAPTKGKGGMSNAKSSSKGMMGKRGSRVLRMKGMMGKSKGKGKGSEEDPCADVEPIVAPVFFDTDATPNAIFGSGNDNGFFTCLRADDIELCLRAKQRFPRANPTGLWSQGDGTYLVPSRNACFSGGFSFNQGFCTPTPIWNFEWTINSDLTDGGRNVDSFEYELGMDADPGCSTDFDLLFPLTTTISVPFWDHSFGDSTTPQAGGQEATNAIEFMNFMANNNVVQQSWNYDFFNDPSTNLFFFDPETVGTYDIYLKAIDTSMECPTEYIVTIQIVTDPDQTLEDGMEVPPFP